MGADAHPGALSEGAATAADSAPVARVLIVDDHEVNRRINAGVCELFSFSCECVSNGFEALEALRRSVFDVVLMDIHMPGMDGLETTRAIRALPGPAGQVPVIAVTSDIGPAQQERYRAGGVFDVTPKPITPARLFRSITAALNHRPPEPRSWRPAEAG
jgi:CheY-like chemotaxis protein